MADLKIVHVLPAARGHSNVHHTILTHLQKNPPPGVSRLEIHVIADEPVRKQFSDLEKLSDDKFSVQFHTWSKTYELEKWMVNGQQAMKTPPASVFDMSMSSMAAEVIFPTPEAYLERYSYLRKVLEDVKPDLVVGDLLTRIITVDTCKMAGIDNYVIVSPGPTMSAASPRQPQGRGFWYYPQSLSNITFPVPWLSIPSNVLMNINGIFKIVGSPHLKKLDAARKEAGIPGSALASVSAQGRAMIYASQPEIEWPHIPPKGTVYCGPIIEHVPRITAKEYPELSSFLDRGRTLLINMGSIVTFSTEEVHAVASAVEIARKRLAHQGGLQLIWKLPTAIEHADVLASHFGDKSDDTLIQKWIEPPSLALLKHPNLVAHVHHGGANSLIEDAYAGVPQILLPMWFDLYTLSVRVETLGHGIYANRGYEPSVNGPLLADAIVRVINDEPGSEGARIRQKAAELAKYVQATGGPKTAVQAIIAAALKRYEDIPFHSPCLP